MFPVEQVGGGQKGGGLSQNWPERSGFVRAELSFASWLCIHSDCVARQQVVESAPAQSVGEREVTLFRSSSCLNVVGNRNEWVQN